MVVSGSLVVVVGGVCVGRVGRVLEVRRSGVARVSLATVGSGGTVPEQVVLPVGVLVVRS